MIGKVNQIVELLRNNKYNSRAIMSSSRPILMEREDLHDIILKLVKKAALSVALTRPLTHTCRTLAFYIMKICKIKQDTYGDQAVISCGINLLDLLCQVEIIDVEKIAVRKSDSSKAVDQWYVISNCQEFSDLVTSALTSQLAFDPTDQVTHWETPTLLNKSKIRTPIVKKADRYKLLDNYTIDKIPLCFKNLNRLADTSWKVNKRMFAYLADHNCQFSPRFVPVEERKNAMASLNKIASTALFVKDLKFKEFNKWLLDVNSDMSEVERTNLSKAKAAQDAEDWKIEKSFDHKEIISQWSIRNDFENIMVLADQWYDSELHFIYNYDSRGRVYSLVNYLQPQGSDVAKSLLLFSNPKPVSTYDLMIHIANCAGEDKGSYDDRIDWVKKHHLAILRVGWNPSGLWEKRWLVASGIINEKKTKLQFIAAAMEYADLQNWVNKGNHQDDFLCRIPIGLDSTSSGLQLFTAVGLDEKAAPYVNLTLNDSGKVGDLYAWLGKFLFEHLKSLEDISTTLKALVALGPNSKVWRKVMKRLAMTYSYSAVAYGMGTMTYEDRKDHGYQETTNLTMSDCKLIGNVAYKIAETNLLQAAKLMSFMRSGIDTINPTSAIVSWVLPDGFTAWQVKDKSKSNTISGTIGTKTVNLKIYMWQNKPDTRRHKNAISPDIIHSLDGLLLRYIIDGLPDDANLHFIHDQFGSDSCYVSTIQDVSKDAYLNVTKRDDFRRICSEAFNKDRPLPESGSWDRNNIYEAEYIIC